MDYQGRTVVITGGTGGLGSAVVQALLSAGAVCHVPHRGDKAGGLRHHSLLTLHPGIDLADETAVEDFYRTVPALWASIHIAGGFAPGTVQTTPKSVLTDQIEINLVTC
ncbi:MAG: SDR family NAD(P)-dependent oxidoreductase, partial [Bradyrhizobiaceae bacterium]|nr:SDR family NAD(P)-dependent oxidoreductase [Bradyrhizobiaceae bacterium]